MAREVLNPNSTAPNDKLGDTPWDYTTKLNNMTLELYDRTEPGEIIDVCNESDFPTQDATTITLESGKGYFIRCPITTSKRFICQGGSMFSGGVAAPYVIYTGVGYMFTVNSNEFRLFDITIACPNSYVWQLTGDTSYGLIFGISCSNIVCVSCIGVAQVVDSAVIVLDRCNFFGAFNGNVFDLTGVGSALQSINRVVLVGMGASGVAVNMGTTVNAEIEIRDLILFGDPSSTAISGLASSGNILPNGLLEVRGCNFRALTTPLTGVAVNDIRVDFMDNSGLSDSQTAADLFLENGSEQISVATQGVFYDIGLPSGGANWASDITDRFTFSTDGYLTYIGETDLDGEIIATATVEKQGGGSEIIEMRIAINWSAGQTGLAKSKSQTQNTQPTSVTSIALTKLTNGDTIRPIFANNGSTQDIIVEVTSMVVK